MNLARIQDVMDMWGSMLAVLPWIAALAFGVTILLWLLAASLMLREWRRAYEGWGKVAAQHRRQRSRQEVDRCVLV